MLEDVLIFKTMGIEVLHCVGGKKDRYKGDVFKIIVTDDTIVIKAKRRK